MSWKPLAWMYTAIILALTITAALSAQDPVVAAKYRKLCSELTGTDDNEKFLYQQRQWFNGRLESKNQLIARLELTAVECRRLHWSCSWREPVDLGLDALYGRYECSYGADWCAEFTDKGKDRCELEPECFFEDANPFVEESTPRCFYDKTPGTYLTNGRVGRQEDPWWDRNSLADEDFPCSEPHCALLQKAQQSFARALQLEKMSHPAALEAYVEAIDAVIDTLGLVHPDTERMMIHARRYLDGFTPTMETSATELRLRDSLSQRLLGLVAHDRSQLRAQ